MRLTFYLSFIFLTFFCQKTNAQSSRIFTSFLPKSILTHVEISNQVRPWFDSLSYRFQVVRISGIPVDYSQSDENIFGSNYYGHYNGPVFLKSDDCTIYPILCQNADYDSVSNTKTMEALFCMEDLKMFSKSLTVYCRGYSGYKDQSQMNSMHITKKVNVKRKWFLFEEDKSYPIATEEWFQKWRKDNWGDPFTRIWYLDKRHYCN